MKRIQIFIVVIIVMFSFSACEKKPAVIKFKDEPFVIETSRDAFDYNLVFDYISVENASGKKIDYENVEILGEVNLNKIGVYTLTIKVNYNGKITDGTLSVHVEDTKAPIIQFLGQELLLLSGEQTTIDFSHSLVIAYDYYDGLVTNRINYQEEIIFDDVGIYPINLVVADLSGNLASHEINVRVTQSIEEYASYLYDVATKMYWGDYYFFDDSLYPENDNLIINHEALMQAVFSEEAREVFERLADPTQNPMYEACGVSFNEIDGRYYLLENLHENRLDYIETVLKIKSRSDERIVFEAISTYLIKDGTYEERKAFILIKVNGIWKVDEYSFPN